jgi:tetraacyldisaccharide 4'-kinase
VSSSADAFFQQVWYDRRAPWLAWLLLPLSWLFGLLVAARRAAYRARILPSVAVARPVVVVGNITVGGTGKTPFTIWLANRLKERGVRVGIVLRGYGGQSSHWPRDVDRQTKWQDVGDEAVLLAERTDAIVVAGPDRVAAAQRAVERGAQIVLCDDGLQHYRLARGCEIAVVDARRGVGNGRMLPSGPLREPRRRIEDVDLVVMTRRPGTAASHSITNARRIVEVVPRLGDAIAIVSGARRPLSSFAGQRVHAVAGIGHPQSFFDALTAAGVEVEAHPLPDHAVPTVADISFRDVLPVLMTEKDAVKCRAIAADRHWAVRMDVTMSEEHATAVTALLDAKAGT